MKKVIFLLSLGLIIGMVSCKKKLSPAAQLEKDIELINEYLDKNELEADNTSTGLHYIIINPGAGNNPTATDKVLVRYKGYFLNDVVFDQSGENGIELSLSNVIMGWKEGIPKIKEGGSIRLFIPSVLAYGEQGASTIAPNTVLAFDVDLLAIVE